MELYITSINVLFTRVTGVISSNPTYRGYFTPVFSGIAPPGGDTPFCVEVKGSPLTPQQTWSKVLTIFTSRWLNQPIWKICSSKWESSPGRGENKKCLKPPPSFILGQLVSSKMFSPRKRSETIWKNNSTEDFESKTPLQTLWPKMIFFHSQRLHKLYNTYIYHIIYGNFPCIYIYIYVV